MNKIVEVKYISPKKGKGLFAKKAIKSNTIIEEAHIILIPNKDYEIIQETSIYNYTYTWDDPKKPDHMNALALGICQFINHSYEPNIKYVYDYENQTIKYITIKNIKEGEELTVNYNGIINDKSPVWFELE